MEENKIIEEYSITEDEKIQITTSRVVETEQLQALANSINQEIKDYQSNIDNWQTRIDDANAEITRLSSKLEPIQTVLNQIG